MKIQTGNSRPISVVTLINIYLIWVITSLPGLILTPILGDLTKVFPHASDLEIQMLSTLPSLIIIPFILLSGLLTEKVSKTFLLNLGAIIFALSGALYFFATSMTQLIAISALLGVGGGLMLPISGGLLSDLFSGCHRTKQFGYASAISDLGLVIIIAFVGYMAEWNWRLPFVFYLLPVISLALMPYLRRDLKNAPVTIQVLKEKRTEKYSKLIDIPRLIRYMLFYGFLGYLMMIIGLNLPFLLENYGDTSGTSGIIIGILFLAMMLPSIWIKPVVDLLGKYIYEVSLLMTAVGLFLIVITRSPVVMCVGSFLTGVAYGIIMPYVYNRATEIATPREATLSLAWVLVMDRAAAIGCPFIVDFAMHVAHTKNEQFPFWLNVTLALIGWGFVLVRRLVLERKNKKTIKAKS